LLCSFYYRKRPYHRNPDLTYLKDLSRFARIHPFQHYYNNNYCSRPSSVFYYYFHIVLRVRNFLDPRHHHLYQGDPYLCLVYQRLHHTKDEAGIFSHLFLQFSHYKLLFRASDSPIHIEFWSYYRDFMNYSFHHDLLYCLHSNQGHLTVFLI
jgi:hypothetical protein